MIKQIHCNVGLGKVGRGGGGNSLFIPSSTPSDAFLFHLFPVLFANYRPGLQGVFPNANELVS